MTLLTFGEFHETTPEFDITFEQYCRHLDGDLVEAFSIRRILDKLMDNFKSIADDLKVSYDTIKDVFKKPEFFKVLKAFGFSIKRMAAAAMKAVKSLNIILLDVFEQMHENGDFNILVSGGKKADYFLNKYPRLKRVTGPMVAGFLIYQWQNMSFSGDFENDFNVSNIANAMSGRFSIEDVFASPNGLKALAQLGTGLALGISFPWGAILPATIYLAFLYTGANRVRDPALQNRVKQAMVKYQPRKKKIPNVVIKKS